MHVHRFGALGENGIVCDTNCLQIISLERSFRLRKPHFTKGFLQWYYIFRRNEDYRKFSFSCRGHDKLDYLSEGQYRAIVTGIGVVFGEHDIVAVCYDNY